MKRKEREEGIAVLDRSEQWAKHLRKVRAGALAVLLLLCMAWPAAANPFSDVPAGHWAYAALEQLSAASLIDGYAPGFFTGARRLTRYEMALSLAGALARLGGGPLAAGGEYDLDSLIAGYNERAERPLTAAESALLRQMVVEFRDELAMLGYPVPRVAEPQPAASPATDGRRYVLDGSFASLARRLLLAGSRATPQRQVLDVPVASFLGGIAPVPELVERVARSTVVPLGHIGSTVLYADTLEATLQVRTWGETALPSLDGSIRMSDYALPGEPLSGWLQPGELAPFWPSTMTRVAVEGVALTPYLQLAGERAELSNLAREASATTLRATVRLGRDVSLSGNVRTVEPPFENSDEETLGVALSVRLGDVVLTTEREIVQRSASELERVTTWALEYSLAEQALVRAGWQTVSDTRSRASVDVNVPVPLGSLRLGLAYEGSRTGESAISMTTLTIAGLGLRVAENAEATAAFSLQDGDNAKRTASLGVRYALSPEAALTLGYKWINFSGGPEEDERLENVTTAEFTIRF